MILAKNYRTVTKFVKVMPRILWPLFFPDTVYLPLTLTLNLSRVTNLRLVFLLHFNYLYYGPIVLGCPSDRPLQPYM